MIPFSELTELVDKVAAKLNNYVAIDVEYSNNNDEIKRLRYSFYKAVTPHIYFKSVQELMSYMENILNPPVDEGVEVE